MIHQELFCAVVNMNILVYSYICFFSKTESISNYHEVMFEGIFENLRFELFEYLIFFFMYKEWNWFYENISEWCEILHMLDTYRNCTQNNVIWNLFLFVLFDNIVLTFFITKHKQSKLIKPLKSCLNTITDILTSWIWDTEMLFVKSKQFSFLKLRIFCFESIRTKFHNES